MRRKSERHVLFPFFYVCVCWGGIMLGIPHVSSSCLECISSQWHSLPPSSSLYFSCCRGDCPKAIKATISTPPPPTPPLHAEIRLGLIFHQQSMKSRENATQQALLWEDTLPVQPPTQVCTHTHWHSPAAHRYKDTPWLLNKLWNQVDAKLKWQSEACWWEHKCDFGKRFYRF